MLLLSAGSLSRCAHSRHSQKQRCGAASSLLLLPCLLLALTAGLPGSAQTPIFTSLYSFGSAAGDGSYPSAALIQARDGSFYGTTYAGGGYGNGTIFEMTPSGAVITLYSFGTNAGDGANPTAPLLQATNGNLYGTTYNGGGGTVFKFTIEGKFTDLPGFPLHYVRINWAGNPDFIYYDWYGPRAGLIQASNGNLYGSTTVSHLHYSYVFDFQTYYVSTYGSGDLFLIAPDDGIGRIGGIGLGTAGDPYADLVEGFDGSLYATSPHSTFPTQGGPGSGPGAILKNGTAFYSFTGGADGANPYAGLVQTGDGNLYGTTSYDSGSRSGTLFMITPGGAFTLLHSFTGADGANPNSSLIQASDGNLYGTTQGGGANGYGTIFKMTPSGTFTTLHDFTGTDGDSPNGLLQARDGTLYGTTSGGGAYGSGTVFALDAGLPAATTLASLSPAAANAGGPAFSLTVKGTNFSHGSTVTCNGAALATTFVSATRLSAAVPAADLAASGIARVHVVDPNGSVSNSMPFTILVTTLKLTAANLTRDPNTGAYTAIVTLQNVGYITASSAGVTRAKLGSAPATNLPQAVGDIAAGSTATATLTFPGSAGSSGSVVALKVSGSFTGGKLTGSLKVTLP